jgi:hypothetical protein
MGKSYVWLITVLLVLCAVGAWGYPNFNGESGIVSLPNTAVAPVGTVNLAVSYEKMYESGVDMKIWPARVNAGIADKLELSGSYTKYDTDPDFLNYQWSAGLKYAVLQEPTDQLGLAIGGSYGKVVSEFEGSLPITRAYLALSKEFDVVKDPENAIKGRFTAGWAYIKFGSPVDRNISKPFAALEFTGDTGATLGLEYRWKDSEMEDDAVFSAVARAPITPDKAWWAEIGTTNTFYGATALFDKQKTFYGIAYQFSGK